MSLMYSRIAADERSKYSRRRVLTGLAVAGVGGLAGCSGGGAPNDVAAGDSDSGNGNTGGNGGNGGDSGGSSGGGGGGGGCPQSSSLSAYDVSGTDFAVVPSFPDGWTKYRETYTESAVEVGFGYPGSAAESGTSYPDNLVLTQVTSAIEKDGLSNLIEQGVYDAVDPVVIDGTEYVVGANQMGTALTFQFTAPGPRDTYYLTSLIVSSEKESCFEGMRSTGRAVLDSLEPNDATTL